MPPPVGSPLAWSLAALAAALTALLVCPPGAEAQFETPSRQFHNQTSFPLDGRHPTVPCESCHLKGIYKGTPSRCYDCHWIRRQDDRYRLQLGAQCDTCHRPAGWTSVQFQHVAVSGGFQLAGRHASVPCTSCHVNNVYKGTPRDCAGCHQKDLLKTVSPNHLAAGFPTSCDTCHGPTTWTGARFNHAAMANGFQLVGRHTSLVCASCHVNSVYHGTPRDCVGCHLTDYQRTASPSHTGAGFPTTCDTCHRATDSSWQQGRFAHQFPITSGPHRQPCSTCHQQSSNYQVFTCLVCHEHDRASMDNKHQGRAGYRYDSLACYSCHPNGRH
jgi:hypothetical protein